MACFSILTEDYSQIYPTLSKYSHPLGSMWSYVFKIIFSGRRILEEMATY